uniref:NADH dehydrogenase subunit 6 n=1 Tax=Caprella penantis TaxID=1282972 RepID=UPI0023D82D21|nr:NADH dehydrogenase subunit 6 [Caprella penantis]WCR50880.1 NADH dehydrogenase subunit 6 [Caprella penantis]
MLFMLIMLLSFVLTNHPLTMGLSLMLTSLLMGILISLTGPSSWLAYMLVMIFVSGMMIIILYMSSLSSNETISPSFFMKYTYGSVFLVAFLVFTASPKLSNNSATEKMFFSDALFSIIYKTYTQLMNPMTTLIIFYLLVVLVTAVNIVKTSKSPLRSNSA